MAIQPNGTTSTAEQIRNVGAALALGGGNNNNNFARQIMMAKMFQGMNGQQLGGYALGKLLRYLIGTLASHQNMKSAEKHKLTSMTPDERAKYLEKVRTEDPSRYDWVKRHADNWEAKGVFDKQAQKGEGLLGAVPDNVPTPYDDMPKSLDDTNGWQSPYLVEPDDEWAVLFGAPSGR